MFSSRPCFSHDGYWEAGTYLLKNWVGYIYKDVKFLERKGDFILRKGRRTWAGRRRER